MSAAETASSKYRLNIPHTPQCRRGIIQPSANLPRLPAAAGGIVKRNCKQHSARIEAQQQDHVTMPRYFFDLHEADGVELDEVGMELPDQAAAERRAIHMMGTIAGDLHVPGGAEQYSLFVRVDKRKVFSVRFELEAIRDQ